MQTTATATQKADAIGIEVRRLNISHYDRASSWLLSLLIFIGLAVFMLLTVWLSNKVFVPQEAVPVTLVDEYREDGEGGGNGIAAGGSQLDTPSESEFVGTDKVTADVEQSLSVLGAAAAAKMPELNDLDAVRPTRQGAYGSGGGIWGGFGSGRGLGHGPGKPGRPRRWEVYFMKGATLDLYARQLDFFRIELAVLMPGNKLAYASGFSKGKPVSRVVDNPAEKEKRYYLTWRTGDLEEADRELLARAGIDTQGRLILKFLPPDVEAQLATLEKLYAGAKANNVKRTRFGVQAAGTDFSFNVMDQSYK